MQNDWGKSGKHTYTHSLSQTHAPKHSTHTHRNLKMVLFPELRIKLCCDSRLSVLTICTDKWIKYPHHLICIVLNFASTLRLLSPYPQKNARFQICSLHYHHWPGSFFYIIQEINCWIFGNPLKYLLKASAEFVFYSPAASSIVKETYTIPGQCLGNILIPNTI